MALALIALHRPLLRAGYAGLVYQQPLCRVSFVTLLNGDPEALARAAELVQAGRAEKVLVAERRAARIVEIGASPSLAAAARAEWKRRQLPEERLQVLSTQATTSWELVRAIDDFLQRQGSTQPAAMLYPEHQTRYLHCVIARSLPAARARGIRVWAYPPGPFSAADWWRKRSAVAKVGVAYLRLAHAVGYGEGEFDLAHWNPERYRQSLPGGPS